MSDAVKPQLHGRDHRAGGRDPIPGLVWPWARRSKGYDASNQTIGGTGSVTTVTFNHDYNLSSGESGFGYFTSSGNTIVLEQAGWYAVTAEIIWFESTSFTYVISISDGMAGAGHYFAGPQNSATTISSVVHFMHRWPANTALSLQVAQSSGGNKNVDAAYLEVAFVNVYTGTENSAMDPDQ